MKIFSRFSGWKNHEYIEYLIDNYCAEETFHEDMEKVVRRLIETFVYGAEAEKIRHYIRENNRHSVIANLEARLVETENKYWAAISAINENLSIWMNMARFELIDLTRLLKVSPVAISGRS